MPLNRSHIFLLLCLICSSCVEPFEPVLEESQEVLVISGMISDQPGRHTLSISRSSPYKKPEFQPVEYCVVTANDQDGEMIHYIYEGEGIYSVDVPNSFLELGDAVSLMVITPDMKEYRSSYETILPCPGFDSLYYEIQEMETLDPEKNRPGIQFYLDMSGESSDSRNILWQVDETWEIWAALFGTHLWLENRSVIAFDSRPLFRCWQNHPLLQSYTATTRNLSSNEVLRMPLNFVSNETDRLSVTYRLRVKQQSLSLDAYNYFQRKNEQAVESGGMYDVQPSTVAGNLYNVNDPEEVVLGYFHASQVREKQIYVHNNNFFEFNIPHIACEYEPMYWGRRNDSEFPVYIYNPGNFNPLLTGDQDCFDCRLQGGDTIRPENWETWK